MSSPIPVTELTESTPSVEGDIQSVIMDNVSMALQVSLWLLYTLNLTNIGEMNSHYVISLKSDVGGYRDTEDKSQSHVSPDQWLLDHPHAGMSTVHLNCLPIQRQHSLTGWIWVSRGWLSTQ